MDFHEIFKIGAAWDKEDSGKVDFSHRARRLHNPQIGAAEICGFGVLLVDYERVKYTFKCVLYYVLATGFSKQIPMYVWRENCDWKFMKIWRQSKR